MIFHTLFVPHFKINNGTMKDKSQSHNRKLI